MKKGVIVLIISFIALFAFKSKAQCTQGVSSGVNLVTNGDFSNGYTDWTYDTTYYTAFTACGSSCYSVPGKIYVGTTPTQFNSAFTNPAQPGNPFLMVDGVCTPNIDLWKQTNIPVVTGTTYYFTIQVTSLDATSETAPGVLQFVINGSPQATTITANQAPPGNWQQYSATWVANVTGNIAIEIQNITTTNCQNGVDFGVDNITFTPGCIAGSTGPVPNLGANFSICGKVTPFNINPNFNAATQAKTNITYTWYKNGTEVTSASGTGPTYYNYSVTGAGTYQVCVDSATSCVKSDEIIISSTYSINLGGPYTLCTPATQTLDAVYTGPGVTYQWYLNGTVAADKISGATSSTYTVSAPGTYYVIVADPICGQQQGSAVVTSNLPTPLGGFFCPTSGTGTASVSGTGTYYWFSSATGGTALNTVPSTSYNATGLTGAGPYTFYVQDSTPTAATAGPSATNTVNGFTNPYGVSPNASDGLLVFNALEPFTINSIQVLPYNYYCAAGVYDSIGIQITNSAGVNLPGSPVIFASPCVTAAQPEPPLTVPINITVPTGTGYKISSYQAASGIGSHNATIGGYLNTTNGGAQPSPQLYAYPTNYSGAATFVSNSAASFNLYYSPDAFPGYYNWSITKYSPCGRTPVTVTANCAAPVKFIDFNARSSGSNVLLIWQTASEQNSNYFSIDRSSDGISFTSIGNIKAAGNSDNSLSYSFTDRNPLDGNNYYRITEYDNDGSVTISSVQSVDITNNDLLVMPNPNSGTFTVTGKTNDGLVTMVVLNSLGQQICEITNQVTGKSFTQVINISNLPSGIYYLQVQTSDNTQVKKIIKE